MGRSLFIIVSDSPEQIRSARNFAQGQGLAVQCFSTHEWEMRSRSYNNEPTLSSGQMSMQQATGAKILPFPGSAPSQSQESAMNKVKTINELESQAIEQAIYEYNGNLTEAAKALGIGRATLYRKVKQYNIDPSVARRKKMAA